MGLQTYQKKRDFSRTSEPKGASTKKGEGGNSFVIQKHDARRLHYDFRLEDEGVLKSWAVTRGPSLVPGEKRLAVHVEDHPLEYGDFEGTIPKGEYGGGTVIVWDRGTWEPIGDKKKGFAKGHLELELHGEKLEGRWHLIRMAKKPREKRENWLLIKGDDEFAREEGDPDILEERPESVKTGRIIADVEDESPGWSSKTGKIEKDEEAPPSKSKVKASSSTKRRKPAKDAKAAESGKRSGAPGAVDPSKVEGAHKRGYPGFIEPELAALKPQAPTGDRWIHEIKFDGYRLQAHVSGGKAKLFTRSGLDWTDRFGKKVTNALAALPWSEAILDGELVVETAGGASDFSALQADLSDERTDRFAFYVFDLLYLDGYDLRDTPLIERKTLLKQLLQGADPVLRYSDHFDEDGDLILRHACRLSLEGVVSKQRDGKYRSGRSRDWIKSKCSARQEFVIAGFVPSTTSSKAIGSLVLGQYDGKKLVHVGRVGTGFSRKVAEDLYRRLEKLTRKTSPFAEALSAEAKRNVRFVKPDLVAEVEFRAWTADNNVRHAAFRGLREDKPAEEVVREGKGAAKEPALPAVKVKLTHPDRLYWKEAGVTKQGLADYYSQVWPKMAPYVVSRPLALIRCPDGYTGQCFFQKHAWKGQHSEILTAADPLDKSDEPILAIDSLEGLIGLVQGAVLEIHPWQSALADLEHPDQIIMDLDPGEDVAWIEVIEAAREVRRRMEDAGLASFVKTSGGKGLHIVSPLKPKAGWDEVKGFAKSIADQMAADDPDRFVATVTKSKRKGKILIDYLRNGRGATAVAPYSTRAREGAPVSMPLSWEELDPSIGPAYFTVANALQRLDNLSSDPWEDFRTAEAPLQAKKKSGSRIRSSRSRKAA